MKKRTVISIFTLLLLIVCFAFTYSKQQTEKDYGLARVTKASGKWIFIRCEPVNDYDVAFEVSPWGSPKNPEEIANLLVTDAIKVGKKKKIDFDGIVIGSAKKDIAIKFK